MGAQPLATARPAACPPRFRAHQAATELLVEQYEQRKSWYADSHSAVMLQPLAAYTKRKRKEVRQRAAELTRLLGSGLDVEKKRKEADATKRLAWAVEGELDVIEGLQGKCAPPPPSPLATPPDGYATVTCRLRDGYLPVLRARLHEPSHASRAARSGVPSHGQPHARLPCMASPDVASHTPLPPMASPRATSPDRAGRDLHVATLPEMTHCPARHRIPIARAAPLNDGVARRADFARYGRCTLDQLMKKRLEQKLAVGNVPPKLTKLQTSLTEARQTMVELKTQLDTTLGMVEVLDAIRATAFDADVRQRSVLPAIMLTGQAETLRRRKLQLEGRLSKLQNEVDRYDAQLSPLEQGQTRASACLALLSMIISKQVPQRAGRATPCARRPPLPPHRVTWPAPSYALHPAARAAVRGHLLPPAATHAPPARHHSSGVTAV